MVMMRFLLCALLFFVGIGRAEEPWGKDSSLISIPKAPKSNGSSPAILLILFHQQFLSEADGPRSHFYPSSSEYTRQSINRWGTGIGFLLGCDRLMRENSDEWLYKKANFRAGYLKLDPVPSGPEPPHRSQ